MAQIPPPFHAFTIKANNGHLQQLITPVHVFTAKEIVDNFKIEQNTFEGQAIWDTGATTTAISIKLVHELKLTPTGKATVQAVNDAYDVNTYLVDIGLPNGVGFRSVQVMEASNLGQYHVLLGMDIINAGDFVITNGGNSTWFSFRMPPDGKKVDYVARAEEIQKKKIRRHKNKGKKRR